jgi:hypothetical protein
MSQDTIIGALEHLQVEAGRSETLDADEWMKKWGSNQGIVKDLATLVQTPAEIAGVGDRETAVFMSTLGLRALRDTRGFSADRRRRYASGIRDSIRHLIDDLRPARTAPENMASLQPALERIESDPEVIDIVRSAIDRGVEVIFPALGDLSGIRPAARISGRCFAAVPRGLLAEPTVVIVVTYGKPDAKHIVEAVQVHERPGPVVLVSSGPEDEARIQDYIGAFDREVFVVQAEQSQRAITKWAEAHGLTPVAGRNFACALGSAQGVSFDDVGAAFVLQAPLETTDQPSLGMFTTFAATDPAWSRVNRAFRGCRTALNSGTIDRSGFEEAFRRYRLNASPVGGGYRRLASDNVLAAANEMRDSLRGELPVQALVNGMWTSGSGIARLLASPTKGRRSGRQTSSASAPLTVSTAPQRIEPPGGGEGGGDGDGDDGRGGDGPEGLNASRFLDVDLVGDISPGERVNVTATIRLSAHTATGEWVAPVAVNPKGGRAIFRLKAHGFALRSNATAERDIPEQEDSEPVVFLLDVLDARERWIELSLYQDGVPLATVTITKFALTRISRKQALRKAAEIDLTVTVNATADGDELRGDSPKGKENLTDRRFGDLIRPDAQLLEQVYQEIENLYGGKDPTEVERALKLIGRDISRCIPKDFLDRLASGRIRSLFVRHEVANAFPFELALLEGEREEFFLADRVMICRWFRDIENAATAETKRIRHAAAMLGNVEIAAAETQLLSTICPNTEPFQNAAEVRSRVLSHRAFELLHFIGHCREDASMPYLELVDGQLRMREIGALRSERAFGAAAPVVVINGCGTIRPVQALFGADSFPSRFLKAKASAFIGTLWPVEESIAHEFSSVFYKGLAAGKGIGAAMLGAKHQLAAGATQKGRRRPSDQEAWRRITLRGYCVFAHPEMKVTFAAA